MPVLTYDPSVKPLAGNLSIGTGDLMGASFEQGMNDTLLGWMSRQSDNVVFGDTGDELSPEELMERYGLKSPTPMREGRAALLAQRKRAEEQRMFAIQNGVNGVGSFVASLGAGMIGSLANPVDFAANVFMPFVVESRVARAAVEGAEAVGLAARTAGRIGRFASGRGLITTGELAAHGLPSGPVFAAILEGTIANAAIEVPLAYEKIVQEHSEYYGVSDALLNVAAGGAFAGGLRLAAKKLGQLLQNLSPATHEAALREVMDGREPAKIIALDEAAIRQIVQERADARVASEIGEIEARGIAPPERPPAGPDAIVDILKRRAASSADTVEQRVIRRLWQRVLDGERDASLFSQAAQMLGLRYAPDETRMPQQYAEGRGGKSTRTAEYENSQKAIAFESAEKSLSELEARIRAAEASGGRAENADYIQRKQFQDAIAELKKEGYGAKKLTADELAQHRAVVERESARAQSDTRMTADEIRLERERRTKQYFEDLLPKTEAERKAFVDRYHAEQAAADARMASLPERDAAGALPVIDKPEKFEAMLDEDIAAKRAELPEEQLAKFDEAMAAKPKPNWKKAYQSVIGCIGEKL